MKKWYGLTRRLVERLTRWTETLFNSEITGQTRADTGYGLGQRFAYVLIMFNLFFDFTKAFIEIFENIMREFTCGLVLLSLVNNDLDVFEIKFHLFETQDHAQPRKLLVGNNTENHRCFDIRDISDPSLRNSALCEWSYRLLLPISQYASNHHRILTQQITSFL